MPSTVENIGQKKLSFIADEIQNYTDTLENTAKKNNKVSILVHGFYHIYHPDVNNRGNCEVRGNALQYRCNFSVSLNVFNKYNLFFKGKKK